MYKFDSYGQYCDLMRVLSNEMKQMLEQDHCHGVGSRVVGRWSYVADMDYSLGRRGSTSFLISYGIFC